MRRLVIPIAMWLSSTTCMTSFGQDADASLAACFKQYLEASFRLRPTDATRLGDHRFDDRLDDLSPKARAAWVDHDRKTLAELPKHVPYEKLSRAGQVDFEIFRHELVKSLWLAENVRPFEEDPRVYNAYTTDCVFLLLVQLTAPRETNIANSIARMKQIPGVLAAARENLRNPPRVVTETAIQQNRGAIEFYEREVFALAGPTPQLALLKAAAEPVVTALLRTSDSWKPVSCPRPRGNGESAKRNSRKSSTWNSTPG